MPYSNTNALALGFTSGLRAATPLAALAWAGPPRFRKLHSTAGKAFTAASALGELVRDKLPSTPARTQPSSVVARCFMGGTAGYLVTRRWSGALLGACGALAGTYAGYYARRGLAKSRGWSDLPIALNEDMLALGIGFLAARR